ncbi:glycosyltransferase [Clostridium beijerinckii]|uniref:tetratricopeptide repeat-containing glycosyltransferase family 2 protein n=1 Tax=Clostridium beijerinckii TaxID=1520 RepID=UPI002226144A|nr:glycosyltransferase [Clostridium beijerinckii]UYZ34261.1 glycosyltransferase [Clostridium beijerinckii]
MKITLCMIVKNEEDNIKMCLTNAFTIVDNAVIVDTGSTDNTKNIIKEFNGNIKLIEHKWNDDFSEARNISLDNADGDWILVLDADEEIFGHKETLINYIRHSKNEAYDIKGVNKVDDGNANSLFYNRFFRNKGYKYYMPIHEQLNVDGNQVGTLDDKMAKIVHYGYSKKEFEKKDKINRNLRILISEYNKDTENSFICYHIGATYASSGDYTSALSYFIQSYEIGLKKGFGGYYYELLKRIAQCIYILKDYNLCIDFLMQFLKDEKLKEFTDLYYILGSCCFELKDYDNAELMFNKCIELGENKSFPTFEGRGTFLPKLMIARIYLKRDKVEKAKGYYLEVAEHKEKLGKDIIDEINLYINENKSVKK